MCEIICSLFQTAYRDNTLGLPKICPPENVMKIDQSILFTYLKQHHIPSRMVLAGVGVNHDDLVEAAQRLVLSLILITCNPVHVKSCLGKSF